MKTLNLALALQLEDFQTGQPIEPNKHFKIGGNSGLSIPHYKPNGIYIFTGEAVREVRINSKIYGKLSFSPNYAINNILRLALVPMDSDSANKQEIDLQSGAFINIHIPSKNRGYRLASESAISTNELIIQQDDMLNLTNMWHMLKSADNITETVYLIKHLGYGKYRLRAPINNAYPRKGTQLLLLKRIVGNDTGITILPFPDNGTKPTIFTEDKDGLNLCENCFRSDGN